jgi:hypothetical protein
MNKLSILAMAIVGLCLSGTSANASDPAPKPVVVQVSGNTTVVPSAPCITYMPTCCAPSGPRTLAEAFHTPSCQCCCAKLWDWLCYKPLPVPCECQGHCCGGSPNCVPPVYAFFQRPCYGGSCAGGACLTGCGH